MDNVVQLTMWIALGIIAIMMIFVIGRQIILWYFKIPEKINLLKKQNELLKQILDKI